MRAKLWLILFAIVEQTVEKSRGGTQPPAPRKAVARPWQRSTQRPDGSMMPSRLRLGVERHVTSDPVHEAAAVAAAQSSMHRAAGPRWAGPGTMERR